jgi:predicted transglutaminase-like cysteine proteinase
MKQIILLILIPFFILEAKNITLSQEEYNNILKMQNASQISARLVKYKRLLSKAKDFSTIKKLSYTNSFYNKILPINDETKYQVDDYWATPKEFLIEGRGDCEDYAIAKYFTLLSLGIKENKLFLAVVKVKNATNYHMILLYIENKNSMPLVLDNLSFKVVPLNKRPKLKVKFIFNEKESFILKNKKIHKKVKIDWGKENKWENILKRVYENNE